jgi:hypothetical protein
MVKIPGADGAGPAGRAEKAGILQKNTVPDGEKNPKSGAVSRPSLSRPVLGPGKAAVPSAPGPAAVPAGPRTLSALIQVLGLPPDTLSASILSFAKHLSLPLNPGLLAKIRRDSLSGEPQAQGRDIQSALALASAAAASKGLELSREALTAYALALTGQSPIDPDQSGGQGQSGGGSPDGSGGSPDGSGDSPDGSGGGSPGSDGSPDGGNGSGNPDGGDGGGSGGETAGGLRAEDLIRAEGLREKLAALEEQSPLLSLLNRAPGKNGERWVVLPFTFSQDGTDYRVVLRVLIDKPFSEDLPGRLALDISGEGRTALRWFFMYHRSAGKAPRLTARFWPPESASTLRAFKKELARTLSIHSKEIDLQNDKEIPLFAPDCRTNILHPINKEV